MTQRVNGVITKPLEVLFCKRNVWSSSKVLHMLHFFISMLHDCNARCSKLFSVLLEKRPHHAPCKPPVLSLRHCEMTMKKLALVQQKRAELAKPIGMCCVTL